MRQLALAAGGAQASRWVAGATLPGSDVSWLTDRLPAVLSAKPWRWRKFRLDFSLIALARLGRFAMIDAVPRFAG